MGDGNVRVGLVVWGMHPLELNEQMVDAVDGLGMDSAWMIDHLLGPTHPGLWRDLPASALIEDPDAFLDPFCVATVLARRTDLLLGISVTDGTRRRAADLLRSVLTVHHASSRGFVLGIGSGEANSLVPFGYDFSRPVGRLEETLRELRSLLDTGRMPEGVGRVGLPVESAAGRPQVWVAAHGPRMLRIAGRYGDGWITSGATSEEFAERRGDVFEAAAAAGRTEPVCAMTPFVFLGDSRESAAAALEKVPLAKLFLLFAPASLWARYGLEHPGGPGALGHPDALPHAYDERLLRELAPRIPLEMYEEHVLVGNADEIAARLRLYADAGCEHFILADMTGLAVSPGESARLMPQLSRLRALLKEDDIAATGQEVSRSALTGQP
jgi:phthiodiolone/phenolphthiodiolone dimycocerosates ketoreductase